MDLYRLEYWIINLEIINYGDDSNTSIHSIFDSEEIKNPQVLRQRVTSNISVDFDGEIID